MPKTQPPARRGLGAGMRPHLSDASYKGRLEFRPDQVDTTGGHKLAAEVGVAYEFWWVSCGACGQKSGAVVHQKILGAPCAHCGQLLELPFDVRDEIRTWRRLQAGPN